MANNAALSDRVLTTTNQFIMPQLVDTVLQSNVLFSRLVTKATKRFNGERMQFPFKYATNTTGGSFSDLDLLGTSTTNNKLKLSFFPSFYHIDSVLPLTEIAVNDTDEKVLDLVQLTIKSDAMDMADGMGTQIYGDGTGNNNKDFLGLAAIVDDGSTVATYGGQSRSTYTTLQSTVTASSGTLTLQKMSTLYNAITAGTVHPNIGITTEAVFSFYEQLLVPQERINKDISMMRNSNKGLNSQTGLVGGTGFTGLDYKGFPILADEKCTSGVLFFLNEDFLDFYALPFPDAEPIPVKGGKAEIVGNDYNNVTGFGFSWSGWIKPTNQAAYIGHTYLGGQLLSANPRRHGKLTGITGI